MIKYKVVQEREVLSFARNLSASGIQFHCQEKLVPASTIELTINFPDSLIPIKLLAKVVWAKELKKIGGFDVGAQFINIDEETAAFINNKILNTLRISREKT